MSKFWKSLIAGGLAAATLGAGAAWADRPNDRNSGVSLTVSVGGSDYDRRGYYDSRYGRPNGYRGRDSRIVNREIYDTRYRARIILTEEIVRTRHGPRLVCTVDARGPQARYVPNKQLRRIARNECSRRAEVRILA